MFLNHQVHFYSLKKMLDTSHLEQNIIFPKISLISQKCLTVATEIFAGLATVTLLSFEGLSKHPANLSPGIRGNSADQISLPWVMIEGNHRLCSSTKVVEYYPNVCIIDDCLEYLYTI